MWRSKNAQRAQARLRFCVARAAVRRRSIYRPVKCWFALFQYILILFLNNVLKHIILNRAVKPPCFIFYFFVNQYPLRLSLINDKINVLPSEDMEILNI